MSSTVRVPWFEVFPVTKRLFERSVYEFIVNYDELIVELVALIFKSPDIVVGPYKSYVPVPV